MKMNREIKHIHRAALNMSGRRLYDDLARALLGRAAACRISGSCPVKDIQQVFEWILCDEPSIFGVDSLRIQTYATATDILPDYLLCGDEYARELSLCMKSAESILQISGENNDYTVALAVHDAMLRRLRYMDDGTRTVHSIVAPLTKGYGVCEGFAKTYQYLLQKKGVPCIPVYGTLCQCGGKPEKHVWNMVSFSGQWAHVDVTLDMTLTQNGSPRRDYFAVSSMGIRADHFFDADGYPRSNSEELEYYCASGLVMSTRSELAKHICARIGAGDRSIVFKLPDNVPKAGITDKVSDVAETALRGLRFCGYYELRYNIDRNVFEIAVGEGQQK